MNLYSDRWRSIVVDYYIGAQPMFRIVDRERESWPVDARRLASHRLLHEFLKSLSMWARIYRLIDRCCQYSTNRKWWYLLESMKLPIDCDHNWNNCMAMANKIEIHRTIIDVYQCGCRLFCAIKSANRSIGCQFDPF